MALKTNKMSKTFVWIILGLLLVGLGGFGVTNLSGNIRSVGAVGDREISVNAYARALQQQMNALQAETGEPVTFQQAQEMGLDREVLGQLIVQNALDHEADQLGLSVGDANLRQQLMQIQAFQGANGQFDRESYRFALQNAGLSEAEFEEQLRNDTSRSLLQGAVLSGNALPDTYTETMMSYLGERRNFTWARLGADALEEELPEPDEAALQAYYDENVDQFTRPETRSITYAWLTPEMLLDDIEIEEETLREQHDARADQYDRPERRLVERLAFDSEEAASDAMAQIEAGGQDFDTLVADRGLELSDVDLGDVTEDQLGGAGEDVFAAQSGSVVGPLPSSLGPALYRINGVLQAESVSFEEARPDLQEELAIQRAREMIANRAENIADLLAGGGTLEDLAAETDLELGEIDWHQGMQDGIAAYEEFRQKAQSLTGDDFPDAELLSDGGVYAMRLDSVNPPEPIPFDEVRDDVRAAWEQAQTRERLTATAEDLAAQLGEGRRFEGVGLEATAEKGRTRGAFIEGVTPELISTVFDMEPGKVQVVGDGGDVIVVRLDAIQPPDEDNPDVAKLRDSLKQQSANSVAQDLYRAYANAIRARAGIDLDQQAINAVHSNFR